MGERAGQETEVNVDYSAEQTEATEQVEQHRDMEFVHDLGQRIAAADSFESILERVLSFVEDLVRCDSCLIYIVQGDQLVLRASRNPHAELLNRLNIGMGEGITGWVAEHREAVAIATHAWTDSRFRMFSDLPEDKFEAFLSVPILCRSRVVGVINVQHRRTHEHSEREIRVISTIGFLVGAELELARIETERLEMKRQLETRKIMERAKGIVQRQLQLDEENAYLTLQKLSRQKRKPIREIAEAIILGEELRANTA
jgi:signal transduction protein with GAF and PtsI domain